MLQSRGLTRAFGDRVVVDHVDLDIRPGRITGFVGANGAGKTTTMRMILGVLAPTSGEVLWNGSPITPEIRRRIGYMPEERGLYPRMKVMEQLVFLARVHGASKGEGRARARNLLDHFEITDHQDDLLENLSLGNQQRVQMAAALIHRPDALVLDEPFSGLDPIAVDAVAKLLRREAGHGPVLFSSHQLELVERLCDDVVILSAGKVVAAGTVESLQGRGPERYRIVLDGLESSWIGGIAGIQVLDSWGQMAVVDLKGVTASDLLKQLMDRAPVAEFARIVPPLSELYRQVA